MKKLWTLCTCCLSVGMMWAQTGNWTDEGNYDTSWWDGMAAIRQFDAELKKKE